MRYEKKYTSSEVKTLCQLAVWDYIYGDMEGTDFDVLSEK